MLLIIYKQTYCDGSTKGVLQRRHLLNVHQLRILNWREKEKKTNYNV
jgi:hypothetical protein